MINEEHNENKSSFGMEKYRYSIRLNSDESINKSNYKRYSRMINVRLLEHFRESWIESARHSNKELDYLELEVIHYSTMHLQCHE